MAPAGVANMGQTCWLATAIQCLCHCPQVVRAMLSDAMAGGSIEAARERCETAAEVSAALRCVVCAYWRSNNDVLPGKVVRSLLRALEEFRPGCFSPDAPCDAHEAISAVVEALHETFLEPELRAYEDAPSYVSVDLKAWSDWNGVNGLSIFTELFQVQIRKQHGWAHEWGLCVSPRPGQTVHEAVAASLADDELVYAPTSLLVSTTAERAKVGDVLLRVAPGFDYELMACGVFTGGHWVAVVRTPSEASGFSLVDDDRVHAFPSAEDVRRCRANVFVYRRVSENNVRERQK